MASSHTENIIRDNYQLLEKVRHVHSIHTTPSLPPFPPSPQLADALLEREVLNYDDLVQLLGPLPHDKPHHNTHELADMW